MADIMIGEIRTEVTVTDTDALLHPAVVEKLVALILTRLADKAQADARRQAETRVGGAQ
jgi:hypothetical protein